MTPALSIIVFGVVVLICAAMLYTSGVFRDLFSRFATSSKIADDSTVLAEAPAEWMENHQFWDGDIEEVAF